MWDFWPTRSGLSRVRLAFLRLSRLAIKDISGAFICYFTRLTQILCVYSVVKKLGRNILDILARSKKVVQREKQITMGARADTNPIVFCSACEDENQNGGGKYSGGIKELNLLIKLLRIRGYEAFMVTYDGKYLPWLIEHQPHISLDEFRHKLKRANDVRCVTSWAIAKSFIQECDHLYFWDMELTLTDNNHFPILEKLYRKKIKKVAAISRTIQAWHMTQFEKPCTVIPNLLDESLWFPFDELRQRNQIGYMNEGPHVEEYLEKIRKHMQGFNLRAEFRLIEGDEVDILAGMRSCEIFLSFNIGKDPLWGEGCPRTIIEALSTGCVVIAFDLVGNQEMIQSGFNGVLLPRYRVDLMTDALIKICQTPGEIDRLRTNALSLIGSCHTLDSRWPSIAEFLELNEFHSYD
jgi:hypothetical protein